MHFFFTLAFLTKSENMVGRTHLLSWTEASVDQTECLTEPWIIDFSFDSFKYLINKWFDISLNKDRHKVEVTLFALPEMTRLHPQSHLIYFTLSSIFSGLMKWVYFIQWKWVIIVGTMDKQLGGFF